MIVPIEPESPPHTSSELLRSVLYELGQGTPVLPRSTDSRFPVQTPLLKTLSNQRPNMMIGMRGK